MDTGKAAHGRTSMQVCVVSALAWQRQHWQDFCSELSAAAPLLQCSGYVAACAGTAPAAAGPQSPHLHWSCRPPRPGTLADPCSWPSGTASSGSLVHMEGIRIGATACAPHAAAGTKPCTVAAVEEGAHSGKGLEGGQAASCVVFQVPRGGVSRCLALYCSDHTSQQLCDCQDSPFVSWPSTDRSSWTDRQTQDRT